MKPPTAITPAKRALTAPQFQSLTEVPPEIERFANITNPRTRAAYELTCGGTLLGSWGFTRRGNVARIYQFD